MLSKKFKIVVTLGATLGLALAGQSPALSTPRSEGVGVASFEGRIIDLREGWGEARSCLVFSDTHTECFPSESLAFACGSGWLCLYEDINGEGRRLSFNDEWWHDLTNWGFERRTSSWRNRQECNDWGALGDGAGGVLDLDPCARASQMGPWHDRAVHVWG